MKITDIKTFALDVPFRGPAPSVLHESHGDPSLPMLFARITTDGGLTGWGEAFAYKLRDATHAALEHVVAPRFLGRDPTDIAGPMMAVRKEFRNCTPGPLTFALSAMDMALWDILGKMTGLPLWRLLGGGGKAALPAYASLPRFGDEAVAAHQAVKAVAAGYRHIKLHEVTYEPVASVRQAIGDSVTLMVDASSAWNVPQAIAMAHRMRPLGLAWLEEPTWPPEDYGALTKVGREGGVPLAAGENVTSVTDLRILCEAVAASFVQPSVGKIGGITEARKAVAIAEAYGIQVVPHAYYLGPALLASLHLIASMAEESLIEHAVFDVECDPYAGRMDLQNGTLPVPDAPGFGLDPDAGFLARYARG